MNLSVMLNNTSKLLKRRSPEILTALGVSGVVTTAYLTAKASFKASEMIRETEDISGTAETPRERLVERSELVWKLYIPPVTTGVLTITCILSARQAGSRRTAAAVSAYSITEKAFSEYREHVVDRLGEKGEQRIHDEINQDSVSANPPKEIYIASGGDVKCCELLTHRYFKSDMETLQKYKNEINARINNELYVTLDEFYDLIGLPHTSQSDILGWDSNKLMDLKFSTVISEGGDPCLAFEYNYLKPL